MRWWPTEPPAELLPDEAAVAADQHGQVYGIGVAGHVQKLDTTGRLLARWGDGGPWDVRLARPVGIAVAEDGTVYIADRDAGRLLTVRQLLPTTR